LYLALLQTLFPHLSTPPPFRHAVLVWRRLLDTKNVHPDIYIANMMLRAARECNIGEANFTYDVMLACMSVQGGQQNSPNNISSLVWQFPEITQLWQRLVKRYSR
jgi:hypothetical protein